MSSPINASLESEECAWCGVAVARDDGYRLGETERGRRAAFCRLEHVVPWGMQRGPWEPGRIAEPAAGAGLAIERCAHCGVELSDSRLVLVRHRGQHRVPDAFCSVDHLAVWARAGGRWR